MKRLAVAAVLLLLITGSALAWHFATPRPVTPAARIAQPGPMIDGNRVTLSSAVSAEGPTPIRSVLNIRERMQYGDYRWDERSVAAGPVWIRIDLHRQILSVFRGGNEIGTAIILYGADSKPTPLGNFPVIAKFKDHRSAPYDAPMPYTLRLTPDGVSIHGSNVRWGAATHGCIGVPTAFAAKLFAAVPTGTPVTILAGEGADKADRASLTPSV